MTTLPPIPLPCSSKPWLFTPPEKPWRTPRYAYPQDAKFECGRCPAQAPCLEIGLRNDDDAVWGGKTRQERMAIRIERRMRPPVTYPPPTLAAAPKPAKAARYIAPDHLPHGDVATYNHHGCRCDPCTAAKTAQSARTRQARRDQERGAA